MNSEKGESQASPPNPTFSRKIKIEGIKKDLKYYKLKLCKKNFYEGWKFNSGNYLFTTDTK